MGKKKKNILGNYVCQVDYLSLRQKIVMPKKMVNRLGESQMSKGSCEWFVFHTKHKLAGPFKSQSAAMDKANELIKQNIKYAKFNK